MKVDMYLKQMHVINESIIYNIFSGNIRTAASAFGHAASTTVWGHEPIDYGHVFGHVYEEGEISKQTHFVRFGGKKKISSIFHISNSSTLSDDYSNPYILNWNFKLVDSLM